MSRSGARLSPSVPSKLSAFSISIGPNWVTNDKTHLEHNESALTLKADLAANIIHFAFGPRADIQRCCGTHTACKLNPDLVCRGNDVRQLVPPQASRLSSMAPGIDTSSGCWRNRQRRQSAEWSNFNVFRQSGSVRRLSLLDCRCRNVAGGRCQASQEPDASSCDNRTVEQHIFACWRSRYCHSWCCSRCYGW